MVKHVLAAALAVVAASAHAETSLLNEGFDDITTLAGSGWLLNNKSVPPGLPWFQGAQSVFAAKTGAEDSYIASNFEASDAGSAINNWMVSPTFSTASAGYVSFYARAAIDTDPAFFDSLSFGLHFGSSAETSAFTSLVSVTPVAGNWTKYTLSFGGQGAGSVGRFAINYFGSPDEANYVGIDSISVTAVPESATWFSMATGLGCMAFALRRRKKAMRSANASEVLRACSVAVGAAALSMNAAAHEEAATAAAPVAVHHQIVVKDKASGELRAATPEEAASLKPTDAARSAAFRAAAPAPSQPLLKYHANGAQGARMTPEFMSYSVAVRQPDAGLAKQCVESEAEADAALKSTPRVVSKPSSNATAE